ncbi:MAG TPA: TRAP transporter small permease [Acetobacteraceae bacterium]|nr:TRAP transporter small permease [Acetobacteraceae bacterium]
MSAPEQGRAARVFTRVADAWNRIERLLVGLLGAFAMIIAVVQVFGRYIDPANAINWAEEVIVYVMVWAIMIIASQLVRTDGMVRPDLVLRLLSPGVQRWVETFNCLVAIAFTFGLLWYGWAVVGTAVLLDQRSSSDLQFPIWIYYTALPTGGALMLGRYVIRLIRYLFVFDPKTMTVGHSLAHEAPADLIASLTE